MGYALSLAALPLGLFVAWVIGPALNPRAWFQGFNQVLAVLGAWAVLVVAWVSVWLCLAEYRDARRLGGWVVATLAVDAVSVAILTGVRVATLIG